MKTKNKRKILAILAILVGCMSWTMYRCGIESYYNQKPRVVGRQFFSKKKRSNRHHKYHY